MPPLLPPPFPAPEQESEEERHHAELLMDYQVGA